MSEIPSINVLTALNPVNSGTGENVLVYNGLEEAIQKYSHTSVQRSEEAWNSNLDSLEAISNARQLALEYLLRTSEKVINSNEVNRDLWADRFTQATTELYGEPESTEVTSLLSKEFGMLMSLKEKEDVSQECVNYLLDIYRPIVAEASKISDIETVQTQLEKEKIAIREYGKAIRDKYQPIFDLVDEADKSEFKPDDLLEIFIKSLNWLKDNDDPEWNQWEVIFKEGTSLSVNSVTRKIKIATRREPSSSQETRGLLAHELLVHALRSKNGYKTGDIKLGKGLPGNLDADEGLGVLSEEAINGEFPEKVYDRYVDIALALGTIDGIQRTRKEMFLISYARQLVRLQLRNSSEEAKSSLSSRVWEHIDRIYRGGPGDNLGTQQAIFTKDISYYNGYKQMAEYLANQFANNKSAAEIFDYLSQAKFDPNNPQHVARVTNPEITTSAGS